MDDHDRKHLSIVHVQTEGCHAGVSTVLVGTLLKRVNWHALEHNVDVAKLPKSMQGLSASVAAALAKPVASPAAVTQAAVERLEKKLAHTFLGTRFCSIGRAVWALVTEELQCYCRVWGWILGDSAMPMD